MVKKAYGLSLLVVKTSQRKFPQEDGIPHDLIEIDKVCHGLLTLAVYRGFIKDLSKDKLCLKPEVGPVDLVYLATEIESDDLKEIKSGFGSIEKAYWFGSLNDSELGVIKKCVSDLERWERPEL